jgi:Cdc6-like AAA superfamily ATPase
MNIAGSGKTFLASKVIDHIQSQLETSPSHGFAFFYCNRNETGRREPLSILRSYVRQLSIATGISDGIRKGLKDLYQDMRMKSSDIGFDTCKQHLHEAVSLYDKTTIVLDALDECEPNSRFQIIDMIDSLLSHSKRVNVFVSSRRDRDIRNIFSKTPNIEIQASDNEKDIQSFVDSEISKHQNWKEMPSSLKQDIVDVLLNRSGEM